jgi:hypothetical protein
MEWEGEARIRFLLDKKTADSGAFAVSVSLWR